MMVLALVGLWILFTILTGGIFIIPRNLSMLFEQSAETAILAVGMTLVIVLAEIDLSVGSLTGLTGGIAAMCQVWFHWGALESIAAGLIVGFVLGLWQGWWVAYGKVPSFIVTLAGMLIFEGILIGLTNSTSISPLSQNFLNVGESYIPTLASVILGIITTVFYLFYVFRQRIARQKFGFTVRSVLSESLLSALMVILITAFVWVMNLYAGIPTPVLILIVIAVFFTFVATRTRFGRHIFAIGGNKEAARMSGIKVKKITLIVFAISGLLAGITGVVLTARLGAGTVDAGTNFELDAIAACVVGGSSLMGGRGTIFGSIIGALFMGSIDNGMSLMNAAPFWEYVVKGFILILAVWVDQSSKKLA
jgi:D-xylose transport system permease protein